MKEEKKEVKKKTSKLAIASFFLGLIYLISVFWIYLRVYLWGKSFYTFHRVWGIFASSAHWILIITIILSTLSFIELYVNPRSKKNKYLTILLAILGIGLSLLSLILIWNHLYIFAIKRIPIEVAID